MRITSISPVIPFVSDDVDRFASAPATASAPTRQCEAVADRTFRFASSVIIVTLLNLTCIAWVYPIASQLAEWAGISLLYSMIVGLGAMLVSIPVVVAATILICARRRRMRQNKTNSQERCAA
jgi:hypothetical protein